MFENGREIGATPADATPAAKAASKRERTRAAKRAACSARPTENQNFTRCTPERTSIRSNSGAERVNSRYSRGVQ